MDDRSSSRRPTRVCDDVPIAFGFDDSEGAWMDHLRQAEAPLADARFGAYVLVEEISRGGQGVVYRAVERGTQRPVALKRLVAGPLASPSMRRRFEHEIEALSALDHPNVVSGLSMEVVDGAPVLAMEWIDGVHINRWRSESRSTTAVVRLMLTVCEAVHHAHQHGVIHRDLKPSNILIDTDGEPHVIDFGLAKLKSTDASDGDSGTRTGRFVGTLPYASLEQLYGNVHDIDVRSDVYALGVILYELLTGKLPYGPVRSAAATARAIESGEPTPPSSLITHLDRDLEAITLKALAKQKESRYQSVDSLAADLRRYMAGEAVEARVPGGLSRLLKTVRGHPFAVSFAVGVFLLTTSVAIAFAKMARENAAQRDTALEAVQRADKEATKAQTISRFLNGMISSVRPGQQGRDVTVREVLEDAVRELESGLEDQPLIEAELRNTLGMTYEQLGLFDEAEVQLRAAVDIHREHAEEDDLDLAVVMNNLGNLLASRGEYSEAERLLHEALGIRRRRLGDGNFLVAQGWNNLGALMIRMGVYPEAISMLRQALEIQRRTTGDELPLIAFNLNNLAKALKDKGEYSKAEAIYREALAVHIELRGETHPDTATILSNLGECLSRKGEYAEAEELLIRSLELLRDKLGDDHPGVAACLDCLCGMACDRKEFAEAESYASQSLDIRLASLGPNHPETAISLNNLARVLMAKGELDEAKELYREALEAVHETLPAGHWHIAAFKSNYGQCLAAMKEFETAEEELLASHSQLCMALGKKHELTKQTVQGLVALYVAWGKPQRAAEWRLRSSVD